MVESCSTRNGAVAFDVQPSTIGVDLLSLSYRIHDLAMKPEAIEQDG